LVWDIEIEKSDSVILEIYGYNPENKIKELLKSTDTGGIISLNDIDPKEFPYLELKVSLIDSLQKTCPYLNYLRIFYDPVMELAISSDKKYAIYKDTVEQGDVYKLSLPVYNISNVLSDTVKVKYTLILHDNTSSVTFGYLEPIKPDSFKLIHFETSTHSLIGNCRVLIEVNPEQTPIEQVHFNNYAFLDFTVKEDNKDPILDVSFDGKNIQDRDVVSSEPTIKIELIDENKYLPLIDTAIFQVYLKYPSGIAYSYIPINSSEVLFIPSSINNIINKANLLFKPTKLVEGEYELKVKAKDESGNSTGQVEYNIHFNVINTRAVNSLVPYPNPFNNNVQFQYSFQGDIPPVYIFIKIFNANGALVKILTEKDIGDLKIGLHVTSTWNGTDNSGGVLPNGVYIYQVEIKDKNGHDWIENLKSKDNDSNWTSGKLIIQR
jgi:hypothetical protein